MHNWDNKPVRKKMFHFDLPKDVYKNSKYEIDFIKNNKCLAKLVNYCSNLKMEPKFINTENSKTNESHKFILSMSQRLDLWSSTKHVLLENLYIYVPNKQQYKTTVQKQ